VRWWLLALCVFALSCVERKLHIRTEPEGALVQVNGRDVGRSPTTWSFSQYGTVRVTTSLDGYRTEQRNVKLKVPWYQYPVVDFFADLIVPVRIRDEHEVTIGLSIAPDRSKEEDIALAAEVAGRAVDLREEMRRLAAEDAGKAEAGRAPAPADGDADGDGSDPE
jgi:hypothetical protein